MTEITSKRRFEEMNRIIHRVKRFYDWIIINEIWEDSFQTPKEQILNFFRCSYELKENLKIDFPQFAKNIEKEIENNNWIKIVLDSANQGKHWNLKNSRSKSIIGKVNTHIHILDPNGKKDRTELTIEINNSKIDCLMLLKNSKLEREKIFNKLNLVL
jgi:hypothetical protein